MREKGSEALPEDVRKGRVPVFGKFKNGGADWILVCLGNPGEKYEGSRHNVGFRVADALGERMNKPIQRLKFKALTNVFTIGGRRVLVMKPITYMNESGLAVAEAARFYKLPPEQVLVISDDVSLDVGRLRVRRSGSAGGHNGLKSIIAHLHSDQFPRIKIGVGQKPHPDYDMADWVLGRFSPQDSRLIDQAADRCCDAIICIVEQGVQSAMNQFNGR